MNAHVSWDLMNDIVDGVLSPDERTTLEAHVADCAECRLQLAQLRSLARQATDVPESIAPPDEVWRHQRIGAHPFQA